MSYFIIDPSSGGLDAQTFITDAGSATSVANTITIVGGAGLHTSGVGSTVTIGISFPTIPSVLQGDILFASGVNTITRLAKNTTSTRYLVNTGTDNNPEWGQVDLSNGVTGVLPVANGGTGASSLTDHGVLIGSGTAAVSVAAVGTDGQVLLGATGADPAFATLTSSGGTITFTPGANTLNLESGSAVAVQFDGDSGSAVPSSGVLTVAGGTNITTSAATSIMTVNLDAAISLATSVTSPLYTVASGDLVLNMTDDAGSNAVSFTNNSDAEVAYIDSLGAAQFTELDVDNININGNTIISSDTDGDITLTPNGTGKVTISYLTQYTLPVAGASGAVQDLADGIGTAGQILMSNGAGSEPSWEDAQTVLTWTEVTGTSQAAAVNSGYIANNAALVTITLPDTAALGSIVRVCGKGAGGWRVAQNAGETIHFLGQDTTTGVGGYLESNNTYASIELLCTVADTEWTVLTASGNIDIV